MARFLCFALLALCAFVHIEGASALRAKSRPGYLGETESYKIRRKENLETIGKLAKKGTYTNAINTRFGGSPLTGLRATKEANRAAIKDKLKAIREQAQAALIKKEKVISQAAEAVLAANQKAFVDVIDAKTEFNPIVKLNAGVSVAADAIVAEQAAKELADATVDANAAIGVIAIDDADDKLTSGLEAAGEALEIASAVVDAEDELAASATNLDQVAFIANEVANVATDVQGKVVEAIDQAVEDAKAVEQKADEAIAAQNEAVVQMEAVADSNVETLKELAEEQSALADSVKLVEEVQNDAAAGIQSDLEQNAEIRASLDANIEGQINLEQPLPVTISLSV